MNTRGHDEFEKVERVFCVDSLHHGTDTDETASSPNTITVVCNMHAYDVSSSFDMAISLFNVLAHDNNWLVS